MKISDYVNSLNFADELTAVNQMLVDAHASTTFWGGRVIKVNGYEGSISIDEVANKVLRAGGQRRDTDDLTLEERIAGIEITRQLRNFYKATDAEMEKRNWLTIIFYYIRELGNCCSCNPYTIRFHTNAGLMEDYFEAYSREKFVQEFGGDVIDSSHGRLSTQILATEEEIRAKFNAQKATV